MEKDSMKPYALLFSLLISVLPAMAQDSAPDPALLARAQAGNAAAQIELGEAFAAGKTVERDLSQAAEWYRKAAVQGSVDGEMHLANLLRDGGKGFPRNPVEAAKWFQKAAEAGDVTAQAAVGVLYQYGQGLPRNEVEAYFWFDLAAQTPGPNQQRYAASRQMLGQHVTTDDLEAEQDRLKHWLKVHPRSAK